MEFDLIIYMRTHRGLRFFPHCSVFTPSFIDSYIPHSFIEFTITLLFCS